MAAPPALGVRVQFNGEGGTLLGTFLLYGIAPMFGVYVVAGGVGAAGAAIGQAAREPAIAIVFIALAVLLLFAGLLILPVMFKHKFLEFYFEKLVIDGQPCKYTGTLGGLFKVEFLSRLLTAITFGIYAPWAFCKMKQWSYENVEVGGQRGRLTFHGEGGSLLGTWLLGAILMSCTAGIYGAWFANDIFAFMWDNTRLDGRNFQFKKDPGGFLGTMILTAILSYCTLFIYYPWGICNIFKWEAERVT